MKVLLVLLLTSLAPLVSPHKILVYSPKFAVSHLTFTGRIADILQDAGFNVTTLLSEHNPSLPDGTKKTRIIRVPSGRTDTTGSLMHGELDFFENDLTISGSVKLSTIDGLEHVAQCRRLLGDRELIAALTAEHFDVVVAEAFDYCGIGLSHVIGAKALASIISFPVHNRMLSDLGAPRMPSFDPSIIGPSFNPHSFFERAANFYRYLLCVSFIDRPVGMVQALFTELHPEMPSLTELHSRAAVSFFNFNPLTDAAAPTLNRIVPIGGIAVNKPQSLNEHWSSLLSLRPRTVLVSFGSIAKASYMKIEKRRAMLKAFARFPYTTFIWKYENVSDEFALGEVANVSNVVLSEWMPQGDLLGDARLSLFITHAGIASCHEASHAGVPVIAVPIFADQPRNAALLVQHGNGRVYDKRALGYADKFETAIRVILDDSSFSENARKLAERLQNPAIPPKELLIRHMTHVARFGVSPSSRPLSIDLSYIETYNIDIFAAVITVILALSWLVAKILSAAWRSIGGRVPIHIVDSKKER